MSTMTIGIRGWRSWASGIPAGARWSDWIAGGVRPDGDSIPPLSELRSIHRRRLSPLARTAFYCAKECLEGAVPIATVFSSAHGEIKRSMKLLEGIASGGGVSPAAFSLSVHNSIAGLFTIYDGHTSPSVSIAAGHEGLGAAFVTGASLVSQPAAGPVLIVCFDEPLPESVPRGCESPPAIMAAAFLLCPNSPQFLLEREPTRAEAPMAHWDQIRHLVAFLDSPQTQCSLVSSRAEWTWTRL